MKRIMFTVLLAGMLFLGFGPVPSQGAEVDLIINKLVEKGVLGEEEARQLLREMGREGSRQESALKETAEKVAKETARKTVKEEAETWARLPEWINRIHFKGDFRLRYQYQDKKKDDGTKTKRNRGRYRWRFGAVADVTKDKKWQVGFGLASGSGDPRSTNQTFTNDFETPDARIDYAYVQYRPFKQWKIIAGQFKNPIYKTKDLVWDSDIRPQGVAAPLNYKVSDQFAFFVNPGLFVLQEFKAEEETPIMFLFQPGVKIDPTENLWIKLAGAWYWNGNVSGNHFKYSSGTNTTDGNGNLMCNYSSLGLDGEVGLKFSGPVRKLVFFGQFIKSDADNDSVGWLAGVKLGRSVKSFGDWEVKYNYRRLERDAVLDFLPDSDFYGGETNSEGHEVEFKFGLAKHVSLALDYYRAEKIDVEPGKTSEPENLFQFDLKFKI